MTPYELSRQKTYATGTPAAPNALSLAYITDVFPGVSLTFISLEIKRLRELGMHIELYAIWKRRQQGTSREAEDLSHDTTYLSPPAIGQLFRAHCYYLCKAPGRYVENLKLCLAEHPNRRFRRRTLYNFLLAPYFATSIAKKPVSHIHAHFAFGAATTAMMAARLVGMSFSFTAHGDDVLIEKVLLPEKVNRASLVIAISEYNKACLLREAPEAEASKIRTVHCGVDPGMFAPRPKAKNLLPLLITVGGLVREKGHEYLIEACRLLRESGIDYRCVIVGEGPKREELERLIRRYSLEQNIQLPGSIPHEDIPSCYTQADIIVHPSISEGIPVALMEAMSMELPVIATSITGIPELITHEEDGILVPPADVAALAGAIKRLLNDQELREQLGRNARRKILKDFNLDTNVSEIQHVFEAELGRATPMT